MLPNRNCIPIKGKRCDAAIWHSPCTCEMCEKIFIFSTNMQKQKHPPPQNINSNTYNLRNPKKTIFHKKWLMYPFVYGKGICQFLTFYRSNHTFFFISFFVAHIHRSPPMVLTSTLTKLNFFHTLFSFLYNIARSLLFYSFTFLIFFMTGAAVYLKKKQTKTFIIIKVYIVQK